MTAVATPPSVSAPQLSGKRPAGDRIFAVIALAAGLSVLVILALIAWSTTKEAWPIFRDDATGFLFSTRWAPSRGQVRHARVHLRHARHFDLALIFAVPVSIGIALFITEVAPAWLKKPVVYVIDLLAVVPSVVFGLWGILVLADADLALLHERERRPVADPGPRRALRRVRRTAGRSSPPASSWRS